MSLPIESEHALHTQIPIDTIEAKIVEDAKKLESLFASACIYRVPEELRKLKESAYTPRRIAIGPLHCNDNHLKGTPMQYIKGSYTNHLLRRLTEGETDSELAKQKRSSVLEECVAAMKQSIDEAKKYYAEKVTLDEKMLLVDGCFILEVLYRWYSMDSSITEADPIFDCIFTEKTIKLDLLLFENQIPFFVLEKLFHLTISLIPNQPKETTLSDLVHAYFGNVMNIDGEEEVLSSSGNSYHILHKLHQDYLPCDHQKKKITDLSELMSSASDLDYAGIKFVSGKEKDPFKVKFSEPKGPFWWCRMAHFEIPTLVIDDGTEVFLRNIIAFEQLCPGVSQHFTSYAHLMDMLVNSKKDIEILKKAKVMHNFLGDSGEATDLFNKLGKETITGEFYFVDTCNEATWYSEHRCWPKNMAHLRRTYFGSPWKFIALCLGFIAFGVSITQFVRSFLKK